ncbi:hypothetical protein QEZ54_09810 [Catellatospora sp. KI3]|uniref:hypothetical protein n=1 Tax=Catellatospora sp. KI3 TaxID=3041620 RepID=UPI002482C4EE|nr:hypothetical protein [Catellatospora sp. KI3]MDI1461262.1 hypothetical protein [Catellatospora sp. KI3]
MDTITALAQELDVTPQQVQDYVDQLVQRDGEPAVIARTAAEPGGEALTDEAAHQVRVRLTH